MRVKVGDFGLATKLAYPEERKRTVCGTPNYIAPEILQHLGHSFEVDIWSTGIIIYTLIVGKPPYESKDVDTTYSRIIANQFSYPPTATVSGEAQQLIQTILQSKPEKRPTLLAIENHSFFTTPGCYTPTALTSSAMMEVPLQCLSVPEKHFSSQQGSSATISDENDPHALNRNMNRVSRPLERKLSPRKVSGDQEEPNRSSAFNTRRSASASRTGRLSGEYKAPGVPSRAGDEKSGSSGGMVTRSKKQAVIPLGVKPAAAAITTTAPPAGVGSHPALQSGTGNGVERRGYVRQFEVYNENKPAKVNQQQLLHLSGDMVPKRSKTCERERRGPSFNSAVGSTHHQKATAVRLASQRYGSSDFQDEETGENEDECRDETSQRDDLNEGYLANDSSEGKMQEVQSGENMEIVKDDEGVREIQHNMERHFQIRSQILETKRTNSGGTRAATGSEGLLLEDPVVDIPRNCRDAWALCDLDDVGVETAEDPRRFSGPSGGTSGSAGAGYVTPPTRANRGNGFGNDADQQRLDYPDTLECMYQTLESSFHPSHTATSQPQVPSTSLHESPKIWVVKYVDYTSKYGLGFLLNTNSAGVYFNDSTKIIMSPDGNLFQYIERRRRGSTGVIEHLIHTHSIRSFPADLTKKVTLLKHFKNYLMDQLTNTNTPQQPQQGEEGSSPFTNPVWLQSYLDKTVVMQQDTPLLPYVKKWVRTRHAILFRLSNRTVQVVFFDNR